MKKLRKNLLALMPILAVAGCSVGPHAQYRADPVGAVGLISCDSTIQPEHQLQLDAVDALMADSKPYAALAQLESESLETDQHWVRRGQLLASIGRLEQAEAVFKGLAERCQSFQGYHGFGLVKLKQQQLEIGLTALRTARLMAPSSASIRNDYGYGLLLNRQFESAVFELRTALELSGGKGAVRQNLAAAYILSGESAGLKLLQDYYAFAEHELIHAKRLALELGQ